MLSSIHGREKVDRIGLGIPLSGTPPARTSRFTPFAGLAYLLRATPRDPSPAAPVGRCLCFADLLLMQAREAGADQQNISKRSAAIDTDQQDISET